MEGFNHLDSRISERMNNNNRITYEIHSMIVKVVVDLQLTRLEMLDPFERSVSGHIYSPPNESVRVIITGRDWTEKKFLVYGCKSLDEAKEYIDEITEEIEKIGHKVKDIDEVEAANIAVNGDFHRSIRVETLSEKITDKGTDAEYEPEQFPGVIVHLEDPSVTFLIFSSGKFVIQGVKSPSQIEPSISVMESLIES